jgi:uncharacterized DUF497 family protein
MKISFDPAKDQANQLKHGLSLKEAALLDWDSALIYFDDRVDYKEIREVAFALKNERLYVVIFTRRRDELRIISLRKANIREVKYYANQI